MTAILEIDLNAIANNWRTLDAMHPGATAGVIKADAYGLGAAQVAPKLFKVGCRHFFTAHLGESQAVRGLVPGAMLCVLNGLFPNNPAEYSRHDLTPALGSLSELAIWRAEAARLGRVLPALLHIDTGMSRLGFTPMELAILAQDASLLEGVRLEYVMTHLVSADTPDDPRNARQAELFDTATRQFPGVKRSFANSSGMFLGDKFHSDLARPGAALYGVNPTPARTNPMQDVVRLSAPILQIRDLQPGETVGYNSFWTAVRPSKIAVLGVGYADGFHRALSNAATARFDGKPVPLVGRVSMDLTTFDVTGLEVKPGDMLELLGHGHGPDALALEAGTNGYEILTSLGRRHQRRIIGA
jgi:alanine racemase